ncbi:uncharacterized protein [Argopecten irradians]|uniref:uncharacterized protein n=1 Tax=Argopecten irradians TaxID=31199 RepID=UPI00371F77D1
MEDLDVIFPEFGSKLRQKDFVLEDGYTFLNHGYKGAVPKPVIEAQQRFEDEARRQPTNTFMRKKQSNWIKSRDSVAEFLNADPDDVVLVPNVTSGINAIMMSIPLKSGDTIIVTNQAFVSTNNACAQLLYHKGITTRVVDIVPPIKDTNQVVKLYRDSLDSILNIRAVVIDYVSCPCAMMFPVAEIVQLCQKYNVVTIVDGAHAPGHIPLSLKETKADFFTGNFHKWLFAPWGCAFVWKNKRLTFPLRSLTSSAANADIASQFCMQGTRDDSCFYSLPAAIQYIRTKGGLEKISAYNTRLLEMASEYLVRLWQTSTLDIPTSMEPPFLRMVRLPEIYGFSTSQDDKNSLMDLIYHDHHIDVCLKSVNDQLYVRLSVHIYNCLDDYKKLGNAVLLLVDRGRRRDSRY